VAADCWSVSAGVTSLDFPKFFNLSHFATVCYYYNILEFTNRRQSVGLLKRLSFSVLVLACFAGQALAQSDALVARDKQMRCGEVTFDRTDTTWPSPLREQIWYSSDGRFRQQVDKSNLDPGCVSANFVNGGNWRYVDWQEKSKARVVFDNASNWPLDDEPLFFLTPRPCFAMGGGLSRVVKWEASNNASSLVGRAGDGATLEVDFSDIKAGMPSRIARCIRGKTINEWTFSGSIPAGGGLSLPATAVLSEPPFPNSGRTIRILKASLGTNPPASDLKTNWFRPDAEIWDYRVQPVVVWKYKELLAALHGKTTLDPDQLLELSIGRAAWIARGMVQKHALEAQVMARQGNALATFGTIFLLVAVGGVFISLLIRRFGRL
jgi:hypothetical protein